MSYDPYQGHYQCHAPYPQQPHGSRNYDNSTTIIRIVRAVTGVATAVFLLHIIFVVFEANQGNAFVAFIYGRARVAHFGHVVARALRRP